MCRFLVFKGRDGRFKVRLSDLIVHPAHSIIHQSFDCRERVTEGVVPPALNADGFGIGWYQDVDPPADAKAVALPADSPTEASLLRHLAAGRAGESLAPGAGGSGPHVLT